MNFILKRVCLVFTFLFIFISLLLAQPKDREAAKTEYPMFWTWLDYRPDANFDSICRAMNFLGIDGLLLNAPSPQAYRNAIPIAKKYGIEVYAWLWTMNLEHDRERILKAHPDWFEVNRNGASLADSMAYVGYYKFLSPVLPEVRNYIKEKIEEYTSIDGLNGIAIDYHRYVDVVLPTTLWPKYGIVQDREYAAWDYGYHPEAIKKFKAAYGYDPRAQTDPSTDLNWRQFRCDQITEVANLIAETVHKSGKIMAASPFPTPKMSSRMVRQDWGKWNLDIVFPMVYSNFYTEDVSFISDCTLENVRDKKAETTLYCGLMASNSSKILADMDAALRSGAQGVAIFTVHAIKDPQLKADFRAFTSQAKAVRAANKGVMPLDKTIELEVDPFKKPGVMKLVERKIQQLIAADRLTDDIPVIQLSDYTDAGSYDVTKRYLVSEKNTGKQFYVTFYFYGGILSGWNVDAING
ncbi:family 10 glycosylhydrolase [Sphingobacterium sp. Mn56C]|uniref:family 10 glycosylhydrolase n=1 Tax=Sphingobacterium sp. Mn56C TaxID=3395261 RepID=UPI003BE23B26